jgi:phage terminase small subunit
LGTGVLVAAGGNAAGTGAEVGQCLGEMSMKLTLKQRLFADEYLIDLNATQAAIRAGYSKKTARQISERLLTKVDIQKAIAQRMKARSERLERTADDVLRDIYDVSKKALAEGDLRTALKAYELDGRHLGLFEDRLKVSGGVEIRIISEFDETP